MSLEENYLIAYNQLKEALANYSPAYQKAMNLIDLTLLDESASDEALNILCNKGHECQVAAVCVLPQHIEKIQLSADIKLATVINFPEGNQTDRQILLALDDLLTNPKIDEIDYVFPYHSYLEGDTQVTLKQCQQVYQLCHQQNIKFKVILETGALPSLEFIYQLSREIIDSGCDFLKTSTGKIVQGATLSAAFTMLKAIKNTNTHCGLKVSGGIKTPVQAFSFMLLAQQVLDRNIDKSWFRIGASSLLDELIQDLG